MTPARVALNTLVVLIILLVAAVLYQVKEILILLLIGILLASAIEPIVDRLHQRGLGRGQSVVVVYIVLAICLGGLLALLVPTVIAEIARFTTTAPGLLDSLRQSVENSQQPFIHENGPFVIEEIERRFMQLDIPTSQALTLATYLPNIFAYFIQSLISIVTLLMIGFFWLTEKALFKTVFLSIFASDERRERARTLWDEIETKLGGWIRGQLILMGVVGAVTSIGYTAMGIKFALLLGVLAGLCELLPLFGPWVHGSLAFLIALTQSWRHALAVVIFIVALQMIEGNVVIPRVMKGSVGLSPLLVILAVLIGFRVLGPVGGIIAIPIAAVIQVLINDLVRQHHSLVAEDGAGRAAQVFRWRPSSLPRRLQGVAPGPAVVSPVVELAPSSNNEAPENDRPATLHPVRGLDERGSQ